MIRTPLLTKHKTLPNFLGKRFPTVKESRKSRMANGAGAPHKKSVTRAEKKKDDFAVPVEQDAVRFMACES